MSSTKICKGCNENKNLDEFTYKTKPNLCKDCASEFYKNEYQKNREKHLTNRAKYYEANKKEILEKMKSLEVKDKRNARNRERRQNDPAFRIGETLKIRMNEVLKTYKNDSSSYLLGCTRQDVIFWLEYQFDDKMSWENYGIYWVVDHVIPISFFDITDKAQQLICFNWTNLRPMEKKGNISKFNKILEEDILLHCQILVEYFDEYQEYQEYFEKSVWSRFTLEYGNNNEDNEKFINFLKSIIRSNSSE